MRRSDAEDLRIGGRSPSAISDTPAGRAFSIQNHTHRWRSPCGGPSAVQPSTTLRCWRLADGTLH